MKGKDSLGDRMKDYYEGRAAVKLPRRSYTVVRVDGKAFHTFTRGLARPFDAGLVEDMDSTATYLCSGIMGAKLGYVRSDEISVVLTDFDDLRTQAWFDLGIQKVCSVAASMATRAFNEARQRRTPGGRWAEFDARVFQLPNITEVENYLVWRQQDASRNSISSVAQSLYSHRELHGVSSSGMQELLHRKGVNWNDLPSGLKRGRAIVKTIDHTGRSRWGVHPDMPVLTSDRDFVRKHVPDRDATTVVPEGIHNHDGVEEGAGGSGRAAGG